MCISFPEIETQHMAKEAPLTINHVFAGIAVADYDAALVWYTRFFGRSPDVIVTENESMWQVAETGWIYLVGDTNRAGKALITLLVNDMEDHVAELEQRGLATSAIETVTGLYRKAVMTDPEGNMISIGEDLSTHA
jgi:predicted enzyme related to lactoylglutathione lyase